MQQPITRDELFKALEVELTGSGAEYLIVLIEKRKVSFELSDSDKGKIRSLQKGLSQKELNDLIEAIKSNHTNVVQQPTTQPQSTLPRGFSEQVTQVMVSLGEHGVDQNIRSDKLNNKKYPISFFDPQHPLGYAYTENGIFYFDAEIFYSFDYPPIKVSHNQVSDCPANWDFNFDDTGFELVDEKQRPRLQIYYATPSRIIIKGIFLSGRHLLFVDDTVSGYLVDLIPEMPDNMKPPKEFNIKPLFKYPSMRYRGQRAQ
jgi:hypothetical protein